MGKKKILLVIPPGNPKNSYGYLSYASPEFPLMGLAYIGAVLMKEGYNVKLIDFEILKKDFKDVYKEIEDFKPDIVGLSANIYSIKRCLKVAEIVKSIDKRIKIILGGPYPTVQSEDAIKNDNVDFIVISEGEEVIKNLIVKFENEDSIKEIAGIGYKRNGNIIKNGNQKLIRDLDVLPYPALELYPLDLYYPPVHIWGRKVAHLITSRGCPYKCSFCEARLTIGNTIRYHSTERVMDEINYLITKYGYTSFTFYDDTFTINKGRVYELCDKLKSLRKKIYWNCFTRTDCIDEKLLRRMREAGCYLISFGAESGDDNLLNILNKKLRVEEIQDAILLTKKVGILANASFMIGLPTETVEQTKKTIDFAVKSNLDYAYFRILEPYPGTPIWDIAGGLGYFINKDGRETAVAEGLDKIWVPANRNRDELEKFLKQAHLKFYLRPHPIILGLNNLFHSPLKRVMKYFLAGILYFFLTIYRETVHKKMRMKYE